MPVSYGHPIETAQAKQVTAATLDEARRHNWAMAVAIVDPAGTLVYFEKIDDTQHGSVQVAIDKARCAALFKRPTKAFQEVLATGADGLRVMAFPGVIPAEGGVPLVLNGRIVGAIGVSGGTSEQDGQCAAAGVNVLLGSGV
jgi:glc operon protein GlcG